MGKYAFTCRSCGAVMAATEELTGKVVGCPSCHKQMTVPTPEEERVYGKQGELQEQEVRLRNQEEARQMHPRKCSSSISALEFIACLNALGGLVILVWGIASATKSDLYLALGVAVFLESIWVLAATFIYTSIGHNVYGINKKMGILIGNLERINTNQTLDGGRLQ